MKKLFFIITFFISSNLYAATYVSCKCYTCNNVEYSDKGYFEESFKITSNKIYLLESEEYKNVTKNVKVWNEEFIKIIIKTVYGYPVEQPPTKSQEKQINKCYEEDRIAELDYLLKYGEESGYISMCHLMFEINYKFIDKEGEIIYLIDRVNGQLKYNHPSWYSNQGESLRPRGTETYNCEVKEKTLF